jgi:hypothetical protein
LKLCALGSGLKTVYSAEQCTQGKPMGSLQVPVNNVKAQKDPKQDVHKLEVEQVTGNKDLGLTGGCHGLSALSESSGSQQPLLRVHSGCQLRHCSDDRPCDLWTKMIDHQHVFPRIKGQKKRSSWGGVESSSPCLLHPTGGLSTERFHRSSSRAGFFGVGVREG